MVKQIRLKYLHIYWMLDSNVIDILTFHFNLKDKIWRNDWQLQEETRYVHVILIQFGVEYMYVNIYKGKEVLAA